MKKIILVIMVGMLVFSLAGCGKNETENRGEIADANENTTRQETAGTVPEAEPESSAAGESEIESAVAGGSNALVVYFSWSGNTENVANAIVNQTGADVFEIVPEEAYTIDYNALLDIATQEKESGARPAIAGSIEDIAQYDIIYVGYAGGIIGLNQEKPTKQGFALV